MATLASLLVRLGVDTRDVKGSLDKGTKGMEGAGKKGGKRFSKGFKKSLTVGLAGAGIAGLVAGAFGQVRQAIDAASDLNETLSKSQQVFGDSAAAVDAFARQAADSIGQSRQQALDAASTFAIFGKSAGLTGGDLVGFSTDLTTLASDLASFGNTTPQEAIDALGAALRGESEPIRKYGVLLDDATLRQKALELGLVKTTKDALTPQQKVLAAQAAIMEQTTDAQGDFARTADQNANAQRIQQARVADLRAELGTKLLPIQLKVTQALATAAQFVGDNINVIGPLVAIIAGLVVVIKLWTIAQTALNIAMSLNPIGIIIIAIIALVVVIVVLWKKSQTFRDIVTGVWKAVWGAIQAVWNWIKNTLWPGIQAVWNGIVAAAKFLWEGVKRYFGFWRGLFETVFGWAAGLWNRVREGFNTLVGFVKGLPGRIRSAASGMWNGIRDTFKSAVNWIIQRWNNLSFTVGGGRFLGQDLPSFTLSTPNIPLLAQGGIVPATPGGTLALIAEAGRDEAVIPLPRDGDLGSRGVTVEHLEVTAVGERFSLQQVQDELAFSGVS